MSNYEKDFTLEWGTLSELGRLNVDISALLPPVCYKKSLQLSCTFCW